ncbi:MAG: AAA family ATPase [Candidatus Komeilibacteria bacterium]|jgi:dephospho-CoA kinase|nr:AAA family ATPase [Candidatus Komeilibacteria bacterium]
MKDNKVNGVAREGGLGQKIILGFTGLISSGKGTAAKYLKEKYKADTFRFSTMLRDVLDRLYLPQSRENFQIISPILREAFGQDLMAKVIAEDVKKSNSNLIAIDGMRRPADIEYLKDIPGFKMIAIEVDEKTRFERLLKRGENTDDATKTFEQFKKEHKAETEIHIPDLMKQADITIDNNGNLEDFYKQLDKLIK